MGGFAYIIYGELSESQQSAQGEKPSLVARLFGKKEPNLKVMESPNGTKRFDISTKKIETPLKQHFERWLKSQLQKPRKATQTSLNYFSIGVQHTYIRAEQTREESRPRWYLQISFSGCSGMAEVSAELFTHWTDKWWETNRTQLEREILLPFGFTPTDKDASELNELRFFPIGDLGYARFFNKKRETFEDFESHFEFDCSVVEAIEEDKMKNLATTLDAEFATSMMDEKCRCQLCAPDFEADKFAEKFPK